MSNVNRNVLRPFGPAHWNSVHDSDQQQRRIARSGDVKFISIDELSCTAVCHGNYNNSYNVSLNECTCLDFTMNLKGSAPCKHIYALAAKLGYMSAPYPIADYISNASDLYHTYLKDHKKGVKHVEISFDTDKKIFGENLKYTLHFSQNVPGFDLVMHIEADDHDIFINKFNILKSSQRSATVFLSKEQAMYFDNAKSLNLVVDLRGLVLRIFDRFSQSKDLCLPPLPSISFDKNIFSNVHFSVQQLAAIKNIFSNPLTYIWGAAGSGKTRYVLAYSVLTYLLSKKRVLITAPTNIALDNALSEIISAGEARINTKTIRRFGFPTEDFASKHPECCDMYVNTQIALLKEKKKNISQYSSYKKNIPICTDLISQIDSYFADVNDLNSANDKIKALTLKRNLRLKERNDKERLLSVKNDDVNKLYSAINAFSFKVKKAFRVKSAQSLEAKYNTSLTELNDLSSEIDSIKADISRLDADASKAQKHADNLRSSIDNSKLSIKRSAIKLSYNLESIPDDYAVLKECVLNYKNHAEERMTEISSQYNDVNFISIGDVTSLLEGIENEIRRLQPLPDDEILLYGYTLDALASQEPSNKFAHIFLDEACYSCIAKAALVFLYKAPVTFLGDHMQLPPVSEIDNKDLNIKKYSPCFVWAQNGIYSADLFNFDYDKMFKAYRHHSLNPPSHLSVSSLNETYRFGAKLSNVLNSYIYKNGFRSGINIETSIKVINAPYKRGLKKHENVSEAQKIKSYLEKAKPSNYVVLSPYKHQAEYLKRFLKSVLSSDNILTVHKSQGQEWDTVILSVTDLPEGFLVAATKFNIAKQVLNTAISRAKKELIIVCDCSAWQTNPNELITELIKIGTPYIASH